MWRCIAFALLLLFGSFGAPLARQGQIEGQRHYYAVALTNKIENLAISFCVKSPEYVGIFDISICESDAFTQDKILGLLQCYILLDKTPSISCLNGGCVFVHWSFGRLGGKVVSCYNVHEIFPQRYRNCIYISPSSDFNSVRFANVLPDGRYTPPNPLKLPVDIQLKRGSYFSSLDGRLRPHFQYLIVHTSPLFFSITVPDPNRDDASSSRRPKAADLPQLQAKFALILGGVLIFGSFKFLSYALHRDDYFIHVGIVGGFIPFAIGVVLILFCFLPAAPPVFWFSVQRVSLSWFGL